MICPFVCYCFFSQTRNEEESHQLQGQLQKLSKDKDSLENELKQVKNERKTLNEEIARLKREAAKVTKVDVIDGAGAASSEMYCPLYIYNTV